MATWEAIMSQEHIDDLKKSRAQLIEQRRALAKVLAGPYDRGKTEQAHESAHESAHERAHESAHERFLELQVAIEAIGRAIDDEAGWQGSGL
jgi:hypothetical protein